MRATAAAVNDQKKPKIVIESKKDISKEARDLLRKIARKNNGILLPEDVLKAAEPKGSPLHDICEWNDGDAAHQYRLWQVRTFIGTVSVVYEDRTEKVFNVESVDYESKVPREWAHIPSDREGGYRQLRDVMKDPEMRREFILNELRTCRSRLSNRPCEEFSPVIEAIDAVISELEQ